MLNWLLNKLFGRLDEGRQVIPTKEEAVTITDAVKYVMPTSSPDVIKYDDPVPKGFMRGSQIPDAIFDRELFVYNCGHSKKHPNDFTVLVKPMNGKG